VELVFGLLDLMEVRLRKLGVELEVEGGLELELEVELALKEQLELRLELALKLELSGQVMVEVEQGRELGWERGPEPEREVQVSALHSQMLVSSVGLLGWVVDAMGHQYVGAQLSMDDCLGSDYLLEDDPELCLPLVLLGVPWKHLAGLLVAQKIHQP